MRKPIILWCLGSLVLPALIAISNYVDMTNLGTEVKVTIGILAWLIWIYVIGYALIGTINVSSLKILNRVDEEYILKNENHERFVFEIERRYIGFGKFKKKWNIYHLDGKKLQQLIIDL